VLRNSHWQDSSLIFILFLTTYPICLHVEHDDGKFPDKRVKKNGMGITLTSYFLSIPTSARASQPPRFQKLRDSLFSDFCLYGIYKNSGSINSHKLNRVFASYVGGVNF